MTAMGYLSIHRVADTAVIVNYVDVFLSQVPKGNMVIRTKYGV